MVNTWINGYEALLDYLANHPDIEINPKSTMILDDARPGFYNLFDSLRIDFVKGHFAGELEKASVLSRNWGKASQTALARLNLTSIDIQTATNWFLKDPLDGLARGLFDPVFSLLKQEYDLAAFEQKAKEIVLSDYGKYMSDGYRRLTAITILNMLLPDELYTVPARDFFSDPVMQEGDLDDGLHEENLPDVVATRQITFEQPLLCSFLTPRILVHSAKINRFVAIRPDYYSARWKARQVSPAQEWIGIKNIEAQFGKSRLWPDLLIYLAPNKEDLTLIADYHRVARPDIMIEFREEADWYEKEGLSLVKKHLDILRPKLGSYVLCQEAVPVSALEELASSRAVEPAGQPADNIRLLHVGNDMTELETVINAMT